ncbi:Anaerobic nitric oxide reductase flavorubredoxin [uncultured Roseburia sp.]|uniref:Flavin reductase n=1 Tax=Brotonthovivens ammoniilytica TaxID=2981725 RepID=A0ABT2TL44_9FIRM|nr:flavin reductase [Brotonthovivens ammoniilytica]MCU6762837.1 flavin reductase [Brotonthovivens ammoniilytica]SCI90723.1 Anaerobic nitric oxide reductase flavorubredoxin [uncultured Roseburia sp.]
MYCTKKITDDLTWVGGNDRRLAMFEGVYSVPDGVSYNSYLLTDDKTVLFDTVDRAVSTVFFENLAHTLDGRTLDYVIIQHMEPDHSATLSELILRYPDVKIIANAKTAVMMKQFFEFEVDSRTLLVKEGDTFETGHHTLTFVMAPMVHWPEVMVTYDMTDKILFSADAFGTFGALNGAIFADEVDFNRDYMDEARRYYCNIVGKYGTQVQALLKKASSLEINMICPLHGFVWRSHIGDYIDKYVKWSTYTPEETGVMIAYASVYGNTENTAEIIASRLRDKGIKTVMYDVSVTPASNIIAAAFQWSHLLFASTTYNAGIFVSMEELLRDLAAHNIQKRTVAFVENGSWAATSGKLMREIIASCKDMNILEETVSLKSSLKPSQDDQVNALVEALSNTIPQFKPAQAASAETEASVDPNALFKLSYGLFVLSAKDGEKDNGCIINTVTQLTDTPKRLTIAVNKQNLTHDMILKTGMFNVSVLTEDVPFKVFQHFGFQSGREADKFDGSIKAVRSRNGVVYLPDYTNAFISGKVIDALDYGTHTLFVAEITEACILSQEPSVTYAYYFEHIKPKPQPAEENKKGFVCKICGYVYEGETLPADFICPLCKHGAEDFEPL